MSQENLCLMDLGWNAFFESHFSNLPSPLALTPARVVEELKGFHRVRCESGEHLAEVSGKMRYQASHRDALPAVGDWVVVAPSADQKHARIELFCRVERSSRARWQAGPRVNRSLPRMWTWCLW